MILAHYSRHGEIDVVSGKDGRSWVIKNREFSHDALLYMQHPGDSSTYSLC